MTRVVVRGRQSLKELERVMAKADKSDMMFHSIDDKIEDALLQERRIFLADGVDGNSAQDLIRKLWYLESVGPGKPITFFIHSPGGSVDAGWAIWDQIQMISSPITTVVTGLAASMGSVLSLSAAPGQRFATPSSRIMIHQPSIHGVIQGQATDLDIHAQEILRSHEKIVKMYCEKSGRDRDAIVKALDRDSWMSAQEALDFGLLDKIIVDFAELEKLQKS